MPFSLAIGRPGMGKSMYDAEIVMKLLKRAEKIRKKLKVIRKIAINFHLRKDLMEKYADYILYWQDPTELTGMRDFDLVIDEISSFFPSDKWKDTPLDVRRMFAQHRKRGMEIFANTQSYKMLDINCRRMLSRVYELTKLVGSRSPSATLPKIKYIWGLIAMIELDPTSLEDDAQKKRITILPDFLVISKRKADLFDTTEDIKPYDPPHVRRCKCGQTQIIHNYK